MEPVSRRPHLIAEGDPLVLRSEPFHHAAHARLVSVELAEIPDLALPASFRDGNRVA